MANVEGVLSTISISQLSRLQLPIFQSPEDEEIAVFLIGLCSQAADTFYRSIQVFEPDQNFQNVVFAHLIAEQWLSSFQVSPGSVILLKTLDQNNLELARYDLAYGFSEQSLQAFVRQHTANHACIAASV